MLRKFSRDLSSLSYLEVLSFTSGRAPFSPHPYLAAPLHKRVSGTCPPSIRRPGARMQEKLKTPYILLFMMRFNALQRTWFTACRRGYKATELSAVALVGASFGEK